MFEEIPRGKILTDKDLIRLIEGFLERVFRTVKKRSQAKPKAQHIREVGVAKLEYDEVRYDKNGWADAEVYAPSRFEIVELRTPKGNANGWYKGGDWYSAKLGDKIKVLQWKPLTFNFIGGPKNVW
jgi:hypothetical protein